MTERVAVVPRERMPFPIDAAVMAWPPDGVHPQTRRTETMPRTIAAGIGLTEYPFRTPSGFWRWIDLCEQGGVDSIWQTDRLISRTPILECMTALAAIAGRTRRIKFGVNVIAVAMRDPVLLAKQCATIDVLSEGRLLPGFGIGSPRAPEWDAMHLDRTTRGRRTDEALEIVSRLWMGEKLTYAGKHFQLTNASISPLPVQAELPMWIGGSSEAAVRRTAKYGTGWQAGSETPETVGQVIAAIKAAAVEAGRAIDEDHYGASLGFRFGSADDPGVAKAIESYTARTGRDARTHFAFGDADAIVERIARYVENDACKFILRPVADGDEDMYAQTRLLVERVLPQMAARWPRAPRGTG
ncbi:MAG: LLM class flavin-dependent oxidoreductase [Betaproteobacteria bacterium]|nr:MAG: LLM class flavin-dependent oxidoreductase [Betaproteobacteria bacterium]